MLLMLLLAITPAEKAEKAFQQVAICKCANCGCKDCKCAGGKCECKDCGGWDVLYEKCIRQNQIIMLAVGCHYDATDSPYLVYHLSDLQGEKDGYIIGIPRKGQMVRIDLPATATRLQIRMAIMHCLFPLDPGWVECPTCPQGRIWKN